MKPKRVTFDEETTIWVMAFKLLVITTLIMLQPLLFGEGLTWYRLYGGANSDRGYSIQQTSDLGFIAVGYTSSFGTGLKDVYLVKTDNLGNTLWTNSHGGPGDDIGYDVQQTADLGYIITGTTNSFGGFEDVFIIKTDADADGNVIWTKIYGGAGNDYGHSVRQTTDLGYIIAGYTDSYGAGLTNVYLIRTDADGDSLWTETYGGTGYDIGMSVRETSDQGYIITGTTNSLGAGGADMYLIRTDANGDTLWTKTSGTLNDEVGNGVQQTADGGYIVCGYSDSPFGSGEEDLYIAKSNSELIGIEEEARVKDQFSLSQHGSNPFREHTFISYVLPKSSNVTISIYNHLGQAVRTLVSSQGHAAGMHTVNWDGKDARGAEVSSGTYFLRFKAGAYHTVRKQIKLR